MDHPAVYLASRVRARHDLSPSATFEELLTVCRARGATVAHSPRLRRPGLYLPEQGVILLRLPAAWVLGHELFHFLVADNAAHGVLYCYPDFWAEEPERAAEVFAGLLCGGGGTA